MYNLERMKPIDLPPDNVADWLRADLRRPAVVRGRETYLSKPTDADREDPPHTIEVPARPVLPPPPLDPALYVPPMSQQLAAQLQWWDWDERQRQAALHVIHANHASRAILPV